MHKYKLFVSILFISAVLGIFSCKESEPQTEATGSDNQPLKNTITKKDIEALNYTEYVLSRSSQQVTGNWLKFQELQGLIESLRASDYTFFSDDEELLRTFVDELKTSVPERLKDPSILARLVALETSMYKLHDEAIYNANDKAQLLNAIREVLVGHSNLIFQINKKLEKDELEISRPQ